MARNPNQSKTTPDAADKAADIAAQARIATRKVAERTDARGTVTVACRLPCGLAVPVDGWDMAADGTVSGCEGRGLLRFRGAADQSALVDASGHGLTSGIPDAAWEFIERTYAKAKWLTSGALFAANKRANASDEAQERGEIDVGFNGLDADKPAPGLQPDGTPEPVK